MKAKFILILALLLSLSAVQASEFSPKAVLQPPVLQMPENHDTVDNPITGFGWGSHDEDATFKVVIKDPDGNKIWSKKYNYADVCVSGGYCTIYPADEQTGWKLLNGQDYKWKVVAKNSEGKENAKGVFDVDAPGAVSIISPTPAEEVSEVYEAYWTKHHSATEYRLVLKQRSGGSLKIKSDWFSADDCDSMCFYTFDEALPVGEYRLKVSSRQAPHSNKSNAKIDFTVVPTPTR